VNTSDSMDPPDPIVHMPVYRIALCVSCKVAVPVMEIEGHLRFSHAGIKAGRRRALLDQFRALSIAKIADDLEPCADGLPPLSFLRPPVPGYFCPHCSSFKTMHWEGLRKHLRDCHDGNHKEVVDKEALSCYLQKWTVRKGVCSRRYWKVDMAALPSNSGATPALISTENDT
jgi:hypothetical protein